MGHLCFDFWAFFLLLDAALGSSALNGLVGVDKCQFYSETLDGNGHAKARPYRRAVSLDMVCNKLLVSSLFHGLYLSSDSNNYIFIRLLREMGRWPCRCYCWMGWVYALVTRNTLTTRTQGEFTGETGVPLRRLDWTDWMGWTGWKNWMGWTNWTGWGAPLAWRHGQRGRWRCWMD